MFIYQLKYLTSFQKSNKVTLNLSNQSIKIYKKLLQLDHVDISLLYEAGKRLINRLKFIGDLKEALKYNELLVKKLPRKLDLINELGVNYLMVEKSNLAKKQFNTVLKTLDPNNSFALCHLAYIMKQYERKINESIDLFKKCLTNKNDDIMDGKFFIHLGDALTRFNRTDEVKFKFKSFIFKNLIKKYDNI